MFTVASYSEPMNTERSTGISLEIAMQLSPENEDGGQQQSQKRFIET